MTSIESNAKFLQSVLQDREVSWVTAESCTGGQLAAIMARDPCLSAYLERGFVVYSIASKCELLNVPVADANRNGAVNAQVAIAMALGALKKSQADYALAITGFCGPKQNCEEVGLVFLGYANRDGEAHSIECHFGDIGRAKVMDAAVSSALELMAEATLKHSQE